MIELKEYLDEKSEERYKFKIILYNPNDFRDLHKWVKSHLDNVSRITKKLSDEDVTVTIEASISDMKPSYVSQFIEDHWESDVS